MYLSTGEATAETIAEDLDVQKSVIAELVSLLRLHKGKMSARIMSCPTNISLSLTTGGLLMEGSSSLSF